jgi:hypothetical protein
MIAFSDRRIKTYNPHDRPSNLKACGTCEMRDYRSALGIILWRYTPEQGPSALELGRMALQFNIKDADGNGRYMIVR